MLNHRKLISALSLTAVIAVFCSPTGTMATEEGLFASALGGTNQAGTQNDAPQKDNEGSEAQTHNNNKAQTNDAIDAPISSAEKKTVAKDKPSPNANADSGTWKNPIPGLTLGGSFRVRGEVKRDFRFDNSLAANDEDYFLSQIRLNAKWKAKDWATFFFEIQDSSIQGEKDINENATPTTFKDDLDVHQAYLDVTFDFEKIPFKLRLGRQKINLGAQRLVASLEWVNTARVHDALRVTMGTMNERTLDAFVSRLVAVNPNSLNDWAKTGNAMFNSDFHGVYFTDWKLIPKTQLELYYFLRHESDRNDSVHTLGTRFETQCGNWDFDGEAMFQTGEFAGNTHLAFAGHLGMGYICEKINNTRFGIAYNVGSGDSDPNDQQHNTFDNLYPLNHAYYGYMDLASLQNIHNFEATVNTKIMNKYRLRLAYQGFWIFNDADSFYSAGLSSLRLATTGVSNFIGSEIDFTIARQFYEGRLAVLVGVSHFFAGSYISDTGNSEDADFYYIQAKWKF